MTETQRHPGWTVQLAIHRAVRRDARRLTQALIDGPAAWDAIGAYWREMADQLHDHHTFEDAVIWPLMAWRLGARVTVLLERNADEHAALAAAMQDFDTAVSTTTDAAVARAAAHAMQTVIETHLSHEEADVLPLIPEAFTLADVAYFVAESGKTNPPPAFLPWLLDDATTADYEFFTGRLPDAVRAQLESEWLPQRRDRVDALRLMPTA